jgi:hypothetical protein
VVRTGLVDAVLRDTEPEPGGQLLETGLPVEPGAALGRLRHQRVEQSMDDLRRHVQAVLQIDRAEQRLQRVGEDARLVPAAGSLLALAQQQVRAEPGRAEAAGDVGERPHVHDARAQLGELPLGQVGMVVEQRGRDHHAEYRVAEELEALVGGQAAVLVRV